VHARFSDHAVLRGNQDENSYCLIRCPCPIASQNGELSRAIEEFPALPPWRSRLCRRAVRSSCDCYLLVLADRALGIAANRWRMTLGKELFDGIEVWAVRGKVENVCAAGFDRFFHAIDQVSADIIHEYDVALLQSRGEYLFDVG
jgi:hypothetical protein